MAKPKKKIVPKKVAEAAVVKKTKVDPRIEKIYEEEITFKCPIRGMVTQKVKIKKFKTAFDAGTKTLLIPGSVIDVIENKDDGLSIYKETDLDADDAPIILEE